MKQPFSIKPGVIIAFVSLISLALFYALTYDIAAISGWRVRLFDPNGFNTYALQAQRWWRGSLDLGRLCQNCYDAAQIHFYRYCAYFPHLEIAHYGGRYWASFPAVPSITAFLLYPFFGVFQPDRLIGFLYLLIGCIFMSLFFKRYTSELSAVFWGFFAGMGSNLLSISVFSGVWFLAQNMSFMFCAMALWAISTPPQFQGWRKKNNNAEAVDGVTRAASRRWVWAFVFWALAVGCRPFQAIYLPILLWFLWRNLRIAHNNQRDSETPSDKFTVRHFIRELPNYAWAPLLIAFVYMVHNFARFGNPLQFGHDFLPEMLRAPYGQFSSRYAFTRGDGATMSNLAQVLRFPEIRGGRLVFPRWNGFFYPLANPIFALLYLTVLFGGIAWIVKQLYRMRTKPSTSSALPLPQTRIFAKWETLILLVLVFITTHIKMTLMLFHTSNGGWHFGVRYFADAIPFLMLLLFIRRDIRARIWDIAVFFFIALPLQIYGTMGWLAGWW